MSEDSNFEPLMAVSAGIVGTQHEILWESVGTTKKVNLEYSRDNFERDIVPIAANILNTGRFVWTTPDTISDHVRIRIQNAEDARVSAQSAKPLSIIGELVLVSPFTTVGCHGWKRASN